MMCLNMNFVYSFLTWVDDTTPRYIRLHTTVNTRHYQNTFPTLIQAANHTIASYSASVVKIYNDTGSLLHFEIKKYFLLL
jgi:hypothetical protein